MESGLAVTFLGGHRIPAVSVGLSARRRSHGCISHRRTRISGFKTKKELKLAIGKPARFIETSFFGPEFKGAGSYTVVGPDPLKRTWFATVTVDGDGNILKIS